MKRELEKKLLKIDRKFKWYWLNYIRHINKISYQHFMEMLSGNVTMRDDVKKAIQAYLEKNESGIIETVVFRGKYFDVSGEKGQVDWNNLDKYPVKS